MILRIDDVTLSEREDLGSGLGVRGERRSRFRVRS